MDSKKQLYHLEPPRGLLNDPNGLAFFQGKYYVFFQWNRFAKDHSYKEWGMFTSPDMIHWTFEGSALLPDQTYDRCGVYSGSGYVIEDRLYLFYTGNVKKENKRKSYQSMAVTENGQKFLKLGCFAETPVGYTEHFRDPKVFKGKDSGYFMLIGAQRQNGKGALALYHSENGQKWEYKGMPGTSEDYEMIECPDLFRIKDQYILLYNLQSRDNERDRDISSFSVGKFVDFNEEEGTFREQDLDHGYFLLDQGFDFYAPQTFEDGNGRRILYAWMSRMEEEQEKVFSEGELRIHCLTLPRELTVADGKLLQNPVKELEALKGKQVPVRQTEENAFRLLPETRTFRLEFLNQDPDHRITVSFYGGDTVMDWIPEEKTVRFSRKNWVSGKEEVKECFAEKLWKAEIWSDQSSIEIFLNGGRQVLSSRIYPEGPDTEVLIRGLAEEKDICMNEINGEYIQFF